MATAKNYKRAFTPGNIQHLQPNEIFVFGSNINGLHGGGAAAVAHQYFDAVWGEGEGLTGQCYALPTMGGGVDYIAEKVKDFLCCAMQHPEKTFLVTRIACGIAGFDDADIAPLFRNALPLTNVLLPKSFVDILEQNSSTKPSMQKREETIQELSVPLSVNQNSEILNAIKYIGADPYDFYIKSDYFTLPILANHRKHWHGIGHIYRVMIGCALLAQKLQKPREGLLAFCGAMLHDLARVNDGNDSQHGSRAATTKFLLFSKLWEKYQLTPQECEFIKGAVSAHSGRNSDFQENRVVSEILHDADALDRCRFHRPSARLDPSYLRIPQSNELIKAMENICEPTRYVVQDMSLMDFIKLATKPIAEQIPNSKEYQRRYTGKILPPIASNQVFVFNQKLRGYSRLRTACAAYQYFNAENHIGEGITGNAYAIPTNVEDIATHVETFIKYAESHPEKEFLVTKIACGGAGKTVEEIAPMFRRAIPIQNILLPREFVEYLCPIQEQEIEIAEEKSEPEHEPVVEKEKKTVEAQLREIPFSFTSQYLKIHPSYLNILEANNITGENATADFLDFDVEVVPSNARKFRITEKQDQLKNEAEKIIAKYEESIENARIKCFPELSSEEKSLSISKRAEIAVQQIIDYLQLPHMKSRCRNLVPYLRAFFLDGKELSTINPHQTLENARINKNKICDLLISANPLFETVTFSEEFKNELIELKDNISFLKEEDAINCCGYEGETPFCNSTLLRLLNFTLATINRNGREQGYIIPTPYTKAIFRTYVEAIHRALLSNTDNRNFNYCVDSRPKTIDEIKEFFEIYCKISNIDEFLFQAVLESYDQIEIVHEDEEVKYQVRYYALSSIADKMARLIYSERGNTVDYDKLIRLDRQQVGVSSVDHMTFENNVRNYATTFNQKYGSIIVSNLSGIWMYNDHGYRQGSIRKHIHSYIEKLGDRLFTYDEILQYLKDQKFLTIPENNVRQYIIESATSAKNEKGRYCPKGYVGNHTEYEWNIKKRDKIEITEEIVQILEEQSSKAIDPIQLANEVVQRMPDCQEDISQIVYSYYANPDETTGNSLFIFDNNDRISLNESYYRTNGTNIIRSDYYSLTASQIIDALLKVKDHKLKEKEILEYKPEYCSEDTFLKNIKKELDDAVLTKDGYWHLIEDNVPADHYVSPTPMKYTFQAYNAENKFNMKGWEALYNVLPVILGAYRTDFEQEKHDFYYDVQFFIDFMSKHARESSTIYNFGESIWRFCTHNLSRYDAYTLMTNVLNDMEGVVKLIYFHNHEQHMPKTKGFQEAISYCTKIQAWTDQLYPGQRIPWNTFQKAYNDVKKQRNDRDHSQLSIPSYRYYQVIENVIILMIYWVNEFVEGINL